MKKMNIHEEKKENKSVIWEYIRALTRGELWPRGRHFMHLVLQCVHQVTVQSQQCSNKVSKICTNQTKIEITKQPGIDAEEGLRWYTLMTLTKSTSLFPVWHKRLGPWRHAWRHNAFMLIEDRAGSCQITEQYRL